MLKKPSNRRSFFRLSGLIWFVWFIWLTDSAEDSNKARQIFPDQPARPDLFEWIASPATSG